MDKQQQALLDRSKEKFIKNLQDSLDNLDKTKALKMTPAGAEGPMICFNQDDTPVFQLAVYHGTHMDYRPQFMSIAKRVLVENGIQVENNID